MREEGHVDGLWEECTIIIPVQEAEVPAEANERVEIGDDIFAA
jgi:hypothetical protein